MRFNWDAISDRENEWDDEALYGDPSIPLVDDDENVPEAVGEIDWDTIWEESRRWVVAAVVFAVWWAVMTVVLS